MNRPRCNRWYPICEKEGKLDVTRDEDRTGEEEITHNGIWLKYSRKGKNREDGKGGKQAKTGEERTPVLLMSNIV
jgi:hypothetical protein